MKNQQNKIQELTVTKITFRETWPQKKRVATDVKLNKWKNLLHQNVTLYREFVLIFKQQFGTNR